MKKRVISILISVVMLMTILSGCGEKEKAPTIADIANARKAGITEQEVKGTDKCSDKSFQILQQSYDDLDQVYTTLSESYANAKEELKSADAEEIFTQAKEYLDKIGDIKQDDLTEDDAEDLAQSMIGVIAALEVTAQSITE